MYKHTLAILYIRIYNIIKHYHYSFKRYTKKNSTHKDEDTQSGSKSKAQFWRRSAIAKATFLVGEKANPLDHSPSLNYIELVFITNQWCFILKRGLVWSLSENRVPKIAWLIINGPAKKVHKRMTHGLLPFLRQSLSPPQGLQPSENVIRPSENKAQISMILFTLTQSNMLKMMHSDLYKQNMQPALWQVAVTMAQPLGIDTWRGCGKGQSSRRKTSWVCSKIVGD